MRRFGVSTRLFDDDRLRPEHLAAIADHGFETVELFAGRTHLDYQDPAAVSALASWLQDTRLEMASVHAPVVVGICMDVGHASLSGDAAEAIETGGGYLTTTRLHDNTRRQDDHLVPFQGAIDWPGVVMAFEKIGYDGIFMFELKRQQSAAATLEQAARARTRLDALAGSWELEAGSFS